MRQYKLDTIGQIYSYTTNSKWSPVYPELFDKSVKVYLNLAEAEVAKHYNFVKSLSVESLESYKQA